MPHTADRARLRARARNRYDARRGSGSAPEHVGDTGVAGGGRSGAAGHGLMAMRGWTTVVGACLGGAFGAGGLWAFVNGVWTVNGVGLLERQGWPLSDPVLFVAVGAVVGLFTGARRAARERGHGREVAEVCEGSGFRYTDEASREDMPGMLLFEGWSKGRHLMSGERGGVPVRVLDLTTIVERQESREVWNRTVALVPAEGLPAFDVRPRTRAIRLLRMAGVEGVTFDPQGVADPAAASEVAEFGALFHLMPSDAKPAGILGADFAPEVEDSERALRRLFTPRLMHAFNRHPGYSAQAAGGALAVWRRGSFLPARERTGLVDAALELRVALTGAAAAEAAGRAEPAVPARPGTDPDSQSDRLRNTVVGAILGFYLGFGAGVCVIFSGRFPKLQGGAVAAGVGTMVVVLGCVVLGVALCAFLGSRVPVRPHAGAHPGTPLTPSQRATRRRLTTAGTVAGFVLGSFGGFAVFATAMFGLHPKAPAPALMAPLFFGSIGLGATAGAVLGGKAARFLYDRRRSRREDPVTSRVPGSPSEVR